MNRKRRILIINPSHYTKEGELVKSLKAYAPMRTPYYIAALTPKRFEVRIVEELVEDLDFSADTDLVALTGMLHNIPRMVDIAKAFNQFQRLSARPTGNEPSTGLGLVIVKRLVELHDGHVWIQSKGIGKGAIFSFSLPIVNTSAQ